jgi:hypothetical protein
VNSQLTSPIKGKAMSALIGGTRLPERRQRDPGIELIALS